MNLGPAEILVILVVALIVFGPKRLPEVGRQVGAAMRQLRQMQESVKSELDGVLNPDVPPGSDIAREPNIPREVVEEPDHTALPAPAPLDATIDEPDRPDESEGFASPGSFS